MIVLVVCAFTDTVFVADRFGAQLLTFANVQEEEEEEERGCPCLQLRPACWTHLLQVSKQQKLAWICVIPLDVLLTAGLANPQAKAAKLVPGTSVPSCMYM